MFKTIHMFVLKYYSIVCYVQRLLFIKAMEHEGTGEQSPYQCVHLLSHLVTMSLDMGKPIDLLSQILSKVKITRTLSIRWRMSTPIR
jgi:hypothetical protein